MELIGIAGAFLVLIAFIGNELGWWRVTHWSFDSLNAVGSALLLYYAWELGSVPFMVLNAIWLAFSLKDIIRRFL